MSLPNQLADVHGFTTDVVTLVDRFIYVLYYVVSLNLAGRNRSHGLLTRTNDTTVYAGSCTYGGCVGYMCKQDYVLIDIERSTYCCDKRPTQSRDAEGRFENLLQLVNKKVSLVTCTNAEHLEEINRTNFLSLNEKPPEFPLQWCRDGSDYTCCKGRKHHFVRRHSDENWYPVWPENNSSSDAGLISALIDSVYSKI
jgi:hypothetical protein